MKFLFPLSNTSGSHPCFSLNSSSNPKVSFNSDPFTTDYSSALTVKTNPT